MDLANTTTATRHQLVAHLQQLYVDLHTVIDRDPEQEILGFALPVVDGVIGASRRYLLGTDESLLLLDSLRDLISAPSVQAAEPIRALDAWLVVGQVLAALTSTCRPPTSLRAAPPEVPVAEQTIGRTW